MGDIAQFVVELEGRAPGGVTRSSAAPTYYGRAEPEGQTVVLGGSAEVVVVGGWAAHEADRRAAARSAATRHGTPAPSSDYGGRTVITGQDALESLLAARRPSGRDPLSRASERLATAVERFDAAAVRGGAEEAWARMASGPACVAVSSATPDDIREAAEETDIDRLQRHAEDAAALAGVYAKGGEGLALPELPALPPLPARGTDPNEGPALSALESASVPRAAAVEAHRGRVAGVFDAAAAALECAC